MAEAESKPRPSRHDTGLYEKRSLFLLSLKNPLRRCAIWMVENGLDDISLIIIIASTICMCLDDPMDTPILIPVSPVRNVLDTSSMIFSVLFLTEASIKITAYGFVLGSKSYLRSGWNIMDFCIAILGAVADFGGGSQSNSEKALRSLRALRPLRTISRFSDLRGLVELLLRVVPRLSYLLGIVFLVVYIFAVIATHLWAGLGRLRCYDSDIGSLYDSTQLCTPGGAPSAWKPTLGGAASLPTGSQPCLRGQQCLPLYGGALAGADYNDVSQSYSTCVQVITMQGWAEIMENVQDSFSPYAGIVFVALVIIVPLNILFLFQGLLLHTLAELRLAELQRRKWKITERLTERIKATALGRLTDYTCTRRVIQTHLNIRAYTKIAGMNEDPDSFRAYLLLRRVNRLWHMQVNGLLYGRRCWMFSAVGCSSLRFKWCITTSIEFLMHSLSPTAVAVSSERGGKSRSELLQCSLQRNAPSASETCNTKDGLSS